MHLFYNLFATLHVSNDYFVHHQVFINLLYLQLCTNRANVPNCLVLRLELVGPSSQARLHGLYRAADTVNHELPMINENVVPNM